MAGPVEKSVFTQDHDPRLKRLSLALPTLAKKLILQKYDLTQPENMSFFIDPDGTLQHAPDWHQWGIITHTRQFAAAMQNEVPGLLSEWGILNGVGEHLTKKIGTESKKTLLDFAVLLHDIGKFTSRTQTIKPDGKVRNRFDDHEKASGQIIRNPDFSQILKTEYNLTPEQIEYIAKNAELHFQLGIVRQGVKKTTGGYNLEFAEGSNQNQEMQEVIQKSSGHTVELGLLFLADSLAKTDIRISANTDEEIASQQLTISEVLKQRHLNPRLLSAVNQLPVNIAVARTYLMQLLG